MGNTVHLNTAFVFKLVKYSGPAVQTLLTVIKSEPFTINALMVILLLITLMILPKVATQIVKPIMHCSMNRYINQGESRSCWTVATMLGYRPVTLKLFLEPKPKLLLQRRAGCHEVTLLQISARGSTVRYGFTVLPPNSKKAGTGNHLFLSASQTNDSNSPEGPSLR